ncbi:MAG: class I SAM-dependent methyltransferase, partial [Gemmataceae bacterium]
CGLVQLRHSYTPEKMYGENYGYRSGLNQSMVEHLRRRVRFACAIAKPNAGDVILDIGSNDSTTLRSYPNLDLTMVGMDPSGSKFASYYPPNVRLIPDFFSAREFQKALPGKKVKIVTSIAMFYDLEDPTAFMADIHKILADDGIWVFEQSYCPSMLDVNAYDTVCHEHISYYALRQIKWMADRVGFKILDVELNDANGGSFCVTVAKKNAPYAEGTERVQSLLQDEEDRGLGTMKPFLAFRERVWKSRDELQSFVRESKRQGRTICGYGASTKGNVLLQFCGLTKEDIPCIAEVNEDKFGRFTPGTMIPICSEKEARSRKPDYFLVLPWHFKKNILAREQAYLETGGKLVFPLPGIEVIARQTGRQAA